MKLVRARVVPSTFFQISCHRGPQKAFRNAPQTTKKAPKNEHLGHAVAHEGVQVDPKTAQGPPMATQVYFETAPTFAFNTELLRSSSKNLPKRPHRTRPATCPCDL